MKNINLLILGSLFSLPVLADSLSDINWLEGHWGNRNGMEEHITSDEGGKIIGLAKEVTSGKLAFFEFFEIEEVGGKLVLKPQPFGKDGAAQFTATEVGGSKVRFENPQNPFPKVIQYERQTSTMISITVEGEQGGKPVRLIYALSKQ